jgi:hypothetical protein
MRGQPSRIGAASLFLAGALGWFAGDAQAQPGPGSQYPNPRLNTVTPCGGKVGTTVEVTFTGTDLDEPQALVFSTSGIKAEPVLPPPPPPPDPKKPKPPPAPKPPITKFKVTIAADAPLGNHDVRIVSRFGVSNPRTFVVGDLTEVMEKEPNNDVAEAQRVELNTTINGAITAPTDVDYFVFAGKKGQRVVISCLASTIDSRLFAGLEVYDSKGKQLASNRNYQGNDALADVSLPADGDYYVRLFEYTHLQGSPEHFYRLTISTAPWIDAVHPCVVQPGKATQVTVYGRNLPNGKPDPKAVVDGRTLETITVTVNPPNDAAQLQRLAYNGLIEPRMGFLNGFEYRVKNGVGSSNPFLLTYARAPVVLGNGENSTAEKAQEITLPCEIAGRINNRRERDFYIFNAKKGELYNIEVLSHRLGAATDMRFVLHNVAAKSDIVELDDNADALSPKFLNRSEDPPVYRFSVPADGQYRLMVTCMHGSAVAGPRQFYRVRITPDQPDFHLVVMPAANNRQDSAQLLTGGNQYYTVYAMRDDGWNGPITLTVEGLPKGVTCAARTLAANTRTTSLLLSAAADAVAQPFTGEIKVKGTAVINGQTVVREARSASITWPVPPQQGVPTVTRLDRGIYLAVREKAPFNLTATLDKPAIIQGDKTTIKLKLARLSPDFKNPLIVTLLEPVPNVIINNNQPLTIAAGKEDGALAVVVNAGAAPGTYQIVFRCQGQVPFNRDPNAKQKPPINVMLPSAPLTLTVLPKQVGTLALAPPNPMVKVGGSTEVVVKVSRQYEFQGEFKVQLVLPANAKGISADPVTIAAGQNEVKLVLKAADDAVPGALNDLIIRAVATVNGNVAVTHDLKFAANVVK